MLPRFSERGGKSFWLGLFLLRERCTRAHSWMVRRNSLKATGKCTQNTLPGTCHNTLFCRKHTLRTPWLWIKLCPRHSQSSARALSSCVFDVVAQRQVHSIPVAPLFTQCFLIQGVNVTSGPHKKLVSIPRRTSSLEGVWPPGRFRSKQR